MSVHDAAWYAGLFLPVLPSLNETGGQSEWTEVWTVVISAERRRVWTEGFSEIFTACFLRGYTPGLSAPLCACVCARA